jgi:hypothetical protein
LAALVVSVIALLRGELTQRALQRAQREDSSMTTNIASLVDVWSSIAKKPSVLRFHGVTEEELVAAGIDIEELAYLIASFETASDYYDRVENQAGSFPKESIRYAMCASESTQKAWPVLRRFFASDSPYFKKVEETMKLCREAEKAADQAYELNRTGQRPTHGLKRTPDGTA